MPTIKIASASCNQTGQHWSNNIENICHAIDMAFDDGADFLCFEELTLTGYECGDNFAFTDNVEIHQHLQRLANYAASKNPNLVLSIGHPWRFADKNLPPQAERLKSPIYNNLNLPFNVQSFISHGQIVAMSAKRYLYNYDRGYEKRHFAEWSDLHANKYRENETDAGHDGAIYIQLPSLVLEHAEGQLETYPAVTIPFGSPVVRVGSINVVHEICEELWIGSNYVGTPGMADYAKDNPLAEKLERYDINLVINPNGSPPAANKIDLIKELLVLNSSIGTGHVTVYTDGLGSSGSTFVQGGLRMMAQNGQIYAQGPRLSFKPFDYTSQVFQVPEAKAQAGVEHAVVPHEFSATPTHGLNHLPADWELIGVDPLQLERRELNAELRHECLWLFDYLRKNKLKGFTQALSGGADSAYNAAKVRMMIELAVRDLGVQGYLDVLSYTAAETAQIQAFNQHHSLDETIDLLMEHTLTCAYLSTPNNSENTKRAAETLIKGGSREDGTTFKGIGGKFYVYDIQPLVDQLSLLYSGLCFDALPKAQVGNILEKFRAFLGLTPDLPPQALNALVDNFRKSVDVIMQLDNCMSGPILTTASAEHGLTIENMQARIRQVIIMMITNVEVGKVGLANPNLDEIINAYTSFGGDEHSGQIALNAHKPKSRQLRQMQLLEQGAMSDIAPVRSFYWVLKNKASAELQPKSISGDVVQYDEDALGRTFYQAHVISHYMLNEDNVDGGGRKNNASEVYEKCRKHPAFEHESLEAVHDMVLLTYKNWGFAQHKIHAFPIAMTYGENVDHQSSLRTPNISGKQISELGALAIHVLAIKARSQGSTFKELTGFSEAYMKNYVGLDAQFAAFLESSMWTPNATDGRKRKIAALFDKIKSKDILFSQHVSMNKPWLQRFFGGIAQNSGEQVGADIESTTISPLHPKH